MRLWVDRAPVDARSPISGMSVPSVKNALSIAVPVLRQLSDTDFVRASKYHGIAAPTGPPAMRLSSAISNVLHPVIVFEIQVVRGTITNLTATISRRAISGGTIQILTEFLETDFTDTLKQ